MRLTSTNKMHASIPLASFYTPREVAQVLADWAILDSRTTVMDPSFGGCAFLLAALERLQRLGNKKPGKQIYGVDIDPNTLPSTKPLLAAGATQKQFIISDFFDLRPEDLSCGLFGAALGNPPYVRYHDIPKELQEKAVARLKEFGIQISGRASYWAFFLLYAMQFLRPGGRLAMVLPGALLHTDYSVQVREALVRHFQDVAVLLLQERVFEKTEEESVLILAAGARAPHQTLHIGSVATVKKLQTAVNNIPAAARLLVKEVATDGGWLRALVEPETIELYDRLAAGPSVIRMGDWVTPRIGVVTGNNDFFILSRTEQREKDLSDKYLVPIIRRPAYFTGLWVTDEDLHVFADNGNKTLLLAIMQIESKLPKAVQNYIRLGVKNGVHNAQKCRARTPWYVVPQTFVPPAFMQCMSAAWPRVVVNQSRYTCTNNILRLSWKRSGERSSLDWLRLALGTLSTLSQLSAELVGRSYGGGVLKVEPTELGFLVVPLIPLEDTERLAGQVDSLLRGNRLSEATELVDSVLISVGIGLTKSGLEQLRAARNSLFFRRRKHRNDTDAILGVQATS